MIDLDDIAAGLAQGELFLEYLPTVSLEDGRCVGAEALVRWRRPSGIVQPDEFIPVVENTPLSGLLTYWVIDAVAAELCGWLRTNPQVHVSINVPPEILGRGGLAYAGDKSGLSEFARQVILEITERGVPDQLGLEAIARGMTMMGVRFALDDVSMNGTNLALLTRCPFNVIKIARTVVQQVSPDRPHPEWLQGLAALLQGSRLDVIAEGVETAYQAEALRSAGIKLAQGFYFSRPISAAGLLEFHARAG
jgi:EAL domain-containing protein (putative c-di-GMP-specific phosphodiesterase class I)